MFQNTSKQEAHYNRPPYYIKLIISKIPLATSDESTRIPSLPNFSSKFVSLGTTLLKKTPNWQVQH